MLLATFVSFSIYLFASRLGCKEIYSHRRNNVVTEQVANISKLCLDTLFVIVLRPYLFLQYCA